MPPPSTETDTDDGPRRRTAYLMIGLALLILAILPAVKLVGYRRDATALDRTPLCAVAGQSGCVPVIESAIAGIHPALRRNGQVIQLTRPAAVAGEYRFDDDAPVLDDADIGDAVDAEVWHGRVIALIRDGHTSFTGAAPAAGANLAPALAVLVGAIGTAFLVKYTVGGRAFDAHAQWRIDFRRGRSILHNVLVLLAVAQALAIVESFGSTDHSGAVGDLVVTFPIVTGLIVLNTLYHLRRERRGRS